MSEPSNLIRTRITELPEDPAPDATGFVIYVRDGKTYKANVETIIGDVAVPASRRVDTNIGLEGGGDLSANIELSISDTGVVADTYGSSTSIPVLAINAQGQVTSASSVARSTTFNDLKFDTSPTGVSTNEGTLSWSSTDHTLNIQTEIPETIIQVGQEQVVRVVNKTGASLTNGKIVYINGAQGNRPTAALASASSEGSSYVIGVITSDIANNAEGYVTVNGLVRGYNTTGFSVGDILYLSTVAGALTNIRPSSPNHSSRVGIALNSTVDGLIYISTENGYELDELHDVLITSVQNKQFLSYDTASSVWKNTTPNTAFNQDFGDGATDVATGARALALETLHVDTKDPTGWVDNTAITVEYDSTARTITLTGDLRYYFNGILYELTSPWTSSAHSATLDDTYFLYSTDGTNFAWSNTVWSFYELMVAAVSYGTNNKYALAEVHGTMPWQDHREFHQTYGTYKVSGGTLSGYTLASTTAANRRPVVAATVAKDEDLQTTIPQLDVETDLATQFYLTSTGVVNFTKGASDIVPLSTNQPYYNQYTGGAWQQTLMSNNSYMSVWLVGAPVTSDAGSQAYRFFWIQGQSNGSLARQKALSPLDVNVGNLTIPEYVFLSQVIIQYTGTNWTLTEVVALSGSRVQITAGATGNYLSTVTTDATLTGTGTSGDALGVNSTIIATTVASQAEMEAGTETALRSMSPLRVSQAISALSVSLSSANTWTGVQTFGAAALETKVAMAANNIDLATGNLFTKTISGATTLTVSNTPATGTFTAFILDLTNGGSNTITWWSGMTWAEATAPTLTASGRDILGFYTHDGGTTWNGVVIGLNMA